MSIYLDNAATTTLDESVLEAMLPYLKNNHGNSSSTHAQGRIAKGAVETSRKKIADLLGVLPAEIIFTSGGTEADNLALRGAVATHEITHIISSPIEHHAVLHTLEDLEKNKELKLSLLDINEKGEIDYQQLEDLLKENPRSLVSLMHGNNEIGNLLDLATVGNLVAEHGGLFHSDTVQTMGHFDFSLRESNVHYAAASAHKFHGPKGSGFAFMCQDHKVCAQQTGGSQERGLRGGTHNVAGIVGLAAALEKSITEQEVHRKHIESVKLYLRDRLKETYPEMIHFNGLSDVLEQSLYTVLNVCFPKNANTEMLLFQLDIQGICASGGSACSSGAMGGSHVIRALGKTDRIPIRFSFGKSNTKQEIDRLMDVLAKVVAPVVAA